LSTFTCSPLSEDHMTTSTSTDTGHRIETRPGTQHVRIEIAGTVIAESRRPLVLEETRCPTRFYLPQEDVHMEMLERTATRTHCPYKGDASYWSVRVGDRLVTDAAWSYENPLPQREDIRGLLCFYGSRVDSFEVDGERAGRG
jgi:uncharacterized protein (DUF427 family)